VYEQLYNAFETFRLAVAMNGLAFPMREHLSDPRITHFANPSFPDANGSTVLSIINRLPSLRWAVPSLLHNERHLFYPPMHRTQEQPGVFAVPSGYLDKTSTWYAWGDIPQKRGILKDLLALTPSTNTAQNDDGTQLAGIVDDKNLLGNALSLTEAMYEQMKTGGELPDFNLDGDRGYGFLCWSQQGDPASDFPDPSTSEAAPPGAVALNFIK
jgi:hypothetical protein